jgi:CheY-like chemotaxis protein
LSRYARAYRQLPGPHAPIVVITAAADGAARAVEIAADEYLAKPFHLDDLFACIARHAGAS